ncbi:Beta/gamma crystallin domain-containing protein 1 [Merluccius polli]|uniref:Beta/gamma crystallin domain-containing protein 1 n=1 Tax=Merluccius polli TaxID=89951 RepID=A0AA47NPS4_MERPO|nr:Beta/gamma crystallin domain-containing protein 1 [Merluccius polli]
MAVVKAIDRQSQAMIVQRSTEMAENYLDKEMLSGTQHLPEEHATLQKGSEQNDKMNESSEESDQQTHCHQDPGAMAMENGAEKAITISNKLSDVIPKAVSDSQKKPQSVSSISAEQKNKVTDHVEKSTVMAATAIGRKMNTSQACIRDNVESEERKAVQEDQQMTSSSIQTKQESVSVLVNSEELKDNVGNAENNVVNNESPGAHNSMKQSKTNDNVVPEDVNVNISEQKVEKANNEQSSSVIEKEKLNKHERKEDDNILLKESTESQIKSTHTLKVTSTDTQEEAKAFTKQESNQLEDTTDKTQHKSNEVLMETPVLVINSTQETKANNTDAQEAAKMQESSTVVLGLETSAKDTDSKVSPKKDPIIIDQDQKFQKPDKTPDSLVNTTPKMTTISTNVPKDCEKDSIKEKINAEIKDKCSSSSENYEVVSSAKQESMETAKTQESSVIVGLKTSLKDTDYKVSPKQDLKEPTVIESKDESDPKPEKVPDLLVISRQKMADISTDVPKEDCEKDLRREKMETEIKDKISSSSENIAIVSSTIQKLVAFKTDTTDETQNKASMETPVLVVDSSQETKTMNTDTQKDVFAESSTDMLRVESSTKDRDSKCSPKQDPIIVHGPDQKIEKSEKTPDSIVNATQTMTTISTNVPKDCEKDSIKEKINAEIKDKCSSSSENYEVVSSAKQESMETAKTQESSVIVGLKTSLKDTDYKVSPKQDLKEPTVIESKDESDPKPEKVPDLLVISRQKMADISTDVPKEDCEKDLRREKMETEIKDKISSSSENIAIVSSTIQKLVAFKTDTTDETQNKASMETPVLVVDSSQETKTMNTDTQKDVFAESSTDILRVESSTKDRDSKCSPKQDPIIVHGPDQKIEKSEKTPDSIVNATQTMTAISTDVPKEDCEKDSTQEKINTENQDTCSLSTENIDIMSSTKQEPIAFKKDVSMTAEKLHQNERKGDEDVFSKESSDPQTKSMHTLKVTPTHKEVKSFTQEESKSISIRHERLVVTIDKTQNKVNEVLMVTPVLEMDSTQKTKAINTGIQKDEFAKAAVKTSTDTLRVETSAKDTDYKVIPKQDPIIVQDQEDTEQRANKRLVLEEMVTIGDSKPFSKESLDSQMKSPHALKATATDTQEEAKTFIKQESKPTSIKCDILEDTTDKTSNKANDVLTETPFLKMDSTQKHETINTDAQKVEFGKVAEKTHDSTNVLEVETSAKNTDSKVSPKQDLEEHIIIESQDQKISKSEETPDSLVNTLGNISTDVPKEKCEKDLTQEKINTENMGKCSLSSENIEIVSSSKQELMDFKKGENQDVSMTAENLKKSYILRVETIIVQSKDQKNQKPEEPSGLVTQAKYPKSDSRLERETVLENSLVEERKGIEQGANKKPVLEQMVTIVDSKPQPFSKESSESQMKSTHALKVTTTDTQEEAKTFTKQESKPISIKHETLEYTTDAIPNKAKKVLTETPVLGMDSTQKPKAMNTDAQKDGFAKGAKKPDESSTDILGVETSAKITDSKVIPKQDPIIIEHQDQKNKKLVEPSGLSIETKYSKSESTLGTETVVENSLVEERKDKTQGENNEVAQNQKEKVTEKGDQLTSATEIGTDGENQKTVISTKAGEVKDKGIQQKHEHNAVSMNSSIPQTDPTHESKAIKAQNLVKSYTDVGKTNESSMQATATHTFSKQVSKTPKLGETECNSEPSHSFGAFELRQASPSSWLDVEQGPKLDNKKENKRRLDTGASEDRCLEPEHLEDFIRSIKDGGIPFSHPPKKKLSYIKGSASQFALPAIKEDNMEKVLDPSQFKFGLRKQTQTLRDPSPAMVIKQKSEDRDGKTQSKRAEREESFIFKAMKSPAKNVIKALAEKQDKEPLEKDQQGESTKEEPQKLTSRLERMSILSNLMSSPKSCRKVREEVSATNSTAPSGQRDNILSPGKQGIVSLALSGTEPSDSAIKGRDRGLPAVGVGKGAASESLVSPSPLPSFSEIKLPDGIEKYLKKDKRTMEEAPQGSTQANHLNGKSKASTVMDVAPSANVDVGQEGPTGLPPKNKYIQPLLPKRPATIKPKVRI